MKVYAIISFLALATALAAQNSSLDAIHKLLPPDAKIIETADLTAATGKPRALVLWMLHPTKVVRTPDAGNGTCADSVYGDYWHGPTRLSLVGGEEQKLINTIEIRGRYMEGPRNEEHNFPLPFLVSNDFYFVPKINAEKEGIPNILNLRDLTGEGVAGQFVLFEYAMCGAAVTSVLGYSRSADSVVQYRVVTSDQRGRSEVVSWVEQAFRAFREKPVRPGHWDYTWEPGHGCDCWIHEDVSFDPVRQMFIHHRKVTRYSSVPPKKL